LGKFEAMRLLASDFK